MKADTYTDVKRNSHVAYALFYKTVLQNTHYHYNNST